MHEASGLGEVVAIHTAPTAGAPMATHAEVVAEAGAGIVGDRYAARQGHWSPIRRAGDGLTLIDVAMLDAIEREHGVTIDPIDTRRNVATRGIDLDALIGHEFTIGEVRARAVRRCEPCSYLDGLLDRNLLPILVHRGGIRVEILVGGSIRVGDPVRPSLA